MPRKRRTLAGWPKVEGRPATREEIERFCQEEESRWNRAQIATELRFCNRCTAPLEVSPCPVCRKVALEKVARFRGLLGDAA